MLSTVWITCITLNTVCSLYLLGNIGISKTSPYLNPLIPSMVNSTSNGYIGADNLFDNIISFVGYCIYFIKNILYFFYFLKEISIIFFLQKKIAFL